MIVRFGYVAMSEMVKNASPSQTMTAKQFATLSNQEAGLGRLERIAKSNIENTLRLLKHNKAHEIEFFRFSSKLVPLVNHPYTEGWKYEKAIAAELKQLGEFVHAEQMRVDFHPDHFVVLNSQSKEITQRSMQTLLYHYKLLKGMNIDPKHRCVLHIGGSKNGKMEGLETFIENFSKIPESLSQMLLLENDDTIYHINDALYLGEKLGIPVVLDLHHHDLNPSEEPIFELWDRIKETWANSPLPIKIHMSSPKEGDMDKRHHDFINHERLLHFLENITADQVDVMIEAKKKDKALLKLMAHIKESKRCEILTEASIRM
ncbi:UV DNA damage repair endonuclease UvsE [Alkalihalobacillus sp. LMS39]|uniref:UV DNA damage repair endonuclease UvsE n=1 Tax=Alkalihalobacillus sp. LMS39 TaxID=2924032 RepID=UPI001FB2BE7C|nr:UV DNA damage repair endonuclease UvsE [Alkalihalobacillus sp. LMS39]UOE92956.1 UV DNA damage repair endonuclease UvsE [Alkalihalobacillus sp. LMS39]